MRSQLSVLLLVTGCLAVASFVDALVAPGLLPLGVLYAIPMLVAARRLSPGATAAVAALALLLYASNEVLRQRSLGAVEVREVTLLVVAYLSYLLAARMREAERARQEAEMARQQLQRFLGMVVHDLRGPMTAILGSAQMAVRPDASPEHRERALATIGRQVRRMDRLVADLADAARIGAGRFEVQPQPTDLAALARRVVETAAAASARHRVRLEAPEQLEGAWDPDRLEQVLTNLVSNAIKYSPDGGEIRLSLRRKEGQAVASVVDQGIGLSPEDLQRLFQPFSRLDTAKGFQGTGLGLYISAAIVQAHGGRLWARSDGAGKGSTFTFTLPLSGSACGIAPPPTAEGALLTATARQARDRSPVA
ncbi:MAG: HAMP domain-containing histidine kinase [Chloroflexi bacterium]|nr:HAMP domain-containing histidine kinase [Chloroflexota bacterium]